MLDLTKFSASNAHNQSLVRDYELTETYNITVDDIQASWVDSLNVTALTAGFLIPVAAVAWWQGFNCLGIVGVVCVVTGAMALRRYDETTRPLLARQRFAMGRVSWEKNQSSGKQKAEVRYVSSRQDSDYSFVDHVLRSDFLSHDQLAGMARSILECGKFNQDVVCKGAKISASDYARLANEMMEQGIIALKPTGQKGYNITKSGYDLLGQLVGSTPPLLN